MIEAPALALAYASAHRRQSLAELQEFARFPSVSAQPRFAPQMKKCAAWLAAHLRRIGLEKVRVVPTAGPPIVYAEWRRAPNRPTLLVYGHYDVQPADPIGEWRSPPFEPTVRGENIYGRGVCDNKGQMLTHLNAIAAYLATWRALPVNVKCLFEGEEEVGSANLGPFIARNRHGLTADAFVLSDTVMLGPEQPALTHATRGDLYLELEVRGPQHDLHSGNFGGAVHNPLQALCEILTKLHGPVGARPAEHQHPLAGAALFRSEGHHRAGPGAAHSDPPRKGSKDPRKPGTKDWLSPARPFEERSTNCVGAK